VVFFDADNAGKKATRAAREPGREAGLAARVASPPNGMDPDELVREKGPETLLDLLKNARGMLEYLIDEALDASFIAADARSRAERVSAVAKLHSEEDDPIVRSMAKSYADQLAGRLDLVRSPEAFRALEASVRRALAVHERTQKTAPKAQKVAQNKGAKQRAEIVGALIEWPELLGEQAVRAELDLLEGESARVVAILASCLREKSPQPENADGPQITLDTAAFLGQMPGGIIQAFAKRRLAAPVHGSMEEARETLLMNASKLRDMLSRDASDVQRELKHAEDWGGQMELVRELVERSKRARGIKN